MRTQSLILSRRSRVCTILSSHSRSHYLWGSVRHRKPLKVLQVPSDLDAVIYCKTSRMSTSESSETFLTRTPQEKAIDVLTGDSQDTILWDECRLIWSSADLVSSDAGPDEVCVFGAEGKSSNSIGEVNYFKIQHAFEDEPGPGYNVHISLITPEAQSRLVNVIYQAESVENGRNVFEDEIRGMTDVMRSAGLQKTLEHILTRHSPRVHINGTC